MHILSNHGSCRTREDSFCFLTSVKSLQTCQGPPGERRLRRTKALSEAFVRWCCGVRVCLLFCYLSSWPLCREYENLKEARRASGELADKLKKDLASSRSKVTGDNRERRYGSSLSCSPGSPELGRPARLQWASGGGL